MIASFNGHLEAVECLLKVTVDFDVQKESGATAVYCASQNGHTAIASALLKYGANSNIMTKDDITRLMTASESGHHVIIDLLRKYGAEVNNIGPSGDTTLHMACYGNHIKAVETLLSLGADPCIANKFGFTPVSYATDETLTIISRYELYSTFDNDISTLSSLPQPSSLPTFDSSPLLSSYKSPNSSSGRISILQTFLDDFSTMSTFEYVQSIHYQNLPSVQHSPPLYHSYSFGEMSTCDQSLVHSAGSRGSIGSRCSAY